MALEFKQVLRWLSPTRWVAAVSNLLLRWVGQRTVLAFITLELFMAGFTMWFYAAHRAVGHLGWIFRSWKSYIIFSGLRICFCCFGYYAVWLRRIHLTKIYYGLFLLGTLLAIMSVLPVAFVHCDCHDWLQCKALTPFEPPGQTLLNPYWEPKGRMYESRRHVAYNEPPEEDHFIIFKEEMLEKRDQAAMLLQRGARAIRMEPALRPAARVEAKQAREQAEEIRRSRLGAGAAAAPGPAAGGAGGCLVVGDYAPGGPRAAAGAARGPGGFWGQRSSESAKKAGLAAALRSQGPAWRWLAEHRELVAELEASSCSTGHGAASFLEHLADGNAANPTVAAPDSASELSPADQAKHMLSEKLKLRMQQLASQARENNKQPKLGLPEMMKKKSAKNQQADAKAERASKGPAGPLRFFNVSPPEIRWVSKEDPDCAIAHVNESQLTDIVARLKNAVKDEDYAVLDPKLTAKLYLCAVDPLCAAVSAQVTIGHIQEPVKNFKVNDFFHKAHTHEDGPSAGEFHLIVCELALQSVPVLKESPDTKDHMVYYFQKNPVTIKHDLEETNSRPNKYYMEVFNSVDPVEGMMLIRERHESLCLCEKTDEDDGCNVFRNAIGEYKFWCWVRESSRETCEDEGIELFWDKKKQKIWSMELCKKAGCSCSNLGMLPMDLSNNKLNKTLLSKNKMNYGGSCKKWKSTDPLSWCYVGFDSNCPDRFLKKKMWVSKDMPEVPTVRMQYKSFLPCQKEEQVNIIEYAEEVCYDMLRIVEALLIFVLILSVPMLVILFKFLSNRCGDEFEAEQQFAVVLSSDDEEEDDGGDMWPAAEPASDGDAKQGAGAD
eukprot:CAMPEP_0168507880 /NCGR_PEP_ID=MMETSP0228-20121227/78100_1 /TAXON_ID=133427 /ORGANISM="Protoceratium reticulatum, Strain CCCM 535 (=CCMP 1889)" /LENGTH=831 /DNA_ID=CAMNT_0008524983 /DNA_START=15 /DNA_END=2509 /DNA_ORIENTATION=-